MCNTLGIFCYRVRYHVFGYMEEVLCVCSDYLSLPSLFVFLRVSSKSRDAILTRDIWQSALRRSGFERLTTLGFHAVIDVSFLNDLRRRIQDTKQICAVCWKTRSPPVRVPSGSIRALCMTCDADLLWSRYDISIYINTLEWKPKKRSLFDKLVIAKRRHRKEMFWAYQVKELCEI